MYANMVWKLCVYDGLTPYKLDGIIYTPISTPYMVKVNMDDLDSIPLEYKWKRPLQNSIDFFIKFEKDNAGNEIIFYDNSVTKGVGKPYKICVLNVGIMKSSEEKPVPFKVNGIEQKANIYLSDNEARDTEGKIIEDNTVVEFIFDTTKAEIDDAYKWIPLKTRYDKTESVIKYGKRYGNNLNIALRIWKTIINPITEENIAILGNSSTYQKEIDRLAKIHVSYVKKNFTYYQRRTSNAAGMRAFNNWIKSNMILTYCKNKSNVLDIGCGRGGDLIKFIHAGINEYVGIDYDNNGLYVINDSAFNRYKQLKKTMKQTPPMYFINADARGLFNVKAQESIIPDMIESNKKLIDTYLSGNKKYDVINCQFTLHYYLSDALSWSNFCKNINDHINDNGYVLVTCFDGKLIYDKLMGKQKMSVSYSDGHGNKNIFFEINKVYADNDVSDIGMPIDLYNSLISNPGTPPIREYLVFPDFLIKSFKKNCNLELVETDTFFNLFNLYKNYFTLAFKEEAKLLSHEIASKTNILSIDTSIKRQNEIREFYLALNPHHQNMFTLEQIDITLASFKLSMLNRYYIFKKVTNIDITVPERVVGINHEINMGKILMPYFDSNKIIINPATRTRQINKIYHAVKKQNNNIKPSVYLIRHSISENAIDNDETIRKNKFSFAKLKDGSDSKILLIYKTPDKYFYPLYHKNNPDNIYLLDSDKIIDDLDILVELTDKFNKKSTHM